MALSEGVGTLRADLVSAEERDVLRALHADRADDLLFVVEDFGLEPFQLDRLRGAVGIGVVRLTTDQDLLRDLDLALETLLHTLGAIGAGDHVTARLEQDRAHGFGADLALYASNIDLGR